MEFKLKLELFICEFNENDHSSFPNFSKVIQNFKIQNISDQYSEWLSKLHENFESRFQEFEKIKSLLEFAKNPLEVVFIDLKNCCETFQIPLKETNMELIKLRSQLSIGSQHIDEIKVLMQFANLRQIYANILSIFPSSYLCESSFSKLNFILNEYRSNMTQEHVKNALIVATSNLILDLTKLVLRMDCQISH